jgi:penicillin-binding protein 2
VQDPEIVVIVLNEHSGFGATNAAPTAMAVVKKWMELKAQDAADRAALAARADGSSDGASPAMAGPANGASPVVVPPAASGPSVAPVPAQAAPAKAPAGPARREAPGLNPARPVAPAPAPTRPAPPQRAPPKAPAMLENPPKLGETDGGARRGA